MGVVSRRPRNPRAGITILEALIVLSIMALLAAVVGPRLVGYLGRAKSDTAAMQIDQITNALHLFYVDVGRYPSEAEGLAVLVTPPPGEAAWAGPYLESQKALTDPWGRLYLYGAPQADGGPRVMSLGRDGEQGGAGEDVDLGQDGGAA